MHFNPVDRSVSINRRSSSNAPLETAPSFRTLLPSSAHTLLLAFEEFAQHQQSLNPIPYREVFSQMMKMIYRTLLVLLLSVSAAYAQQTGITGKVTDAQGAAIADAAVEVKQVGASAFTTKTNAAGTYLIPSLSAGDYVVTVTASGFSTVRTKVSMLVGQTPDVDVTLPISGTNESVVVEASAIAVDTTSSTGAGNITPDDGNGLPIKRRNYMALASLVPRVRLKAITNDT